MVKNQFNEREMGETKRRAKYTLEYKMEAVRLVSLTVLQIKALSTHLQVKGEP